MRLLAAMLAPLAVAHGHKQRFELKKDHGVQRLRSLASKFRTEYENPISARVLLLTDDHYNQLKARAEEIKSYDIQ